MRQLPLSLIIIFLLAVSVPIHAGLIDMYKKGVIKLTPSPNFGKGTDWEGLFYDTNKRLAVAPDGSIFVSNSMLHKIYKFSPDGQFIKEFAQYGQGPGDVISPFHIFILDNKYVAVEESPEVHRISIFDFSGKFVDVIRMGHYAWDIEPLKDNKILYHYSVYPKDRKEARSWKNAKTNLVLIDVKTRKEKTLLTVEVPVKVNFEFSWRVRSPKGAVHTHFTQDGNLIVGVDHLPHLRVYSPEGKLLREFKLNLKPVPRTEEYNEKLEEYSERVRKKRKEYKSIKEFLKKMPQVPHWENLPLYRTFTMDSEGNILVFKEFGCFENCPKVFQVYSPEGKYICETRIDEGNYTFTVNRDECHICFTDKGIIGLFSIRDSDDVSMRLLKVDVK